MSIFIVVYSTAKCELENSHQASEDQDIKINNV